MLFDEDFKVLDEVPTYWKLDPEDLMDSYGHRDAAEEFLSHCTDDVRCTLVQEYGEEVSPD